MTRFTPPQIIMIQALATGATITAAAKLASVSRPTIYSWLENPAFKQAIAFAQQEYAITRRDRMLALSAKALDKLEGLLDDPRSSPSVILKASLAILNRKQWTLPALSMEESAMAIDRAAAKMEADPEMMKDEAEYQRQLTDLYTKFDSVAPRPSPDGPAQRPAPSPLLRQDAA